MLKKIKKINWKDILIRAGKTFIQAFISAFTVDSLFGITTVENFKKALTSLAISAVAAGISAVWNFVVEIINTKIGVENDE